jgi:cell division protein FtsB
MLAFFKSLGFIYSHQFYFRGYIMTCAQKKQKDIRFEKEAKALKKNLEKRKKQEAELKQKNKTLQSK